MLELNNLTIETRHPIITSVSCTFYSGNLYGLVAVNGSGKTTLFRTIVGLLPKISGSVILNGEGLIKQKKKFFYFESHEWFDDNLSGMDYLLFIKEMWESKSDIDKVIEFWNMEEFINIPIKKYSLGMKQRLLISLYLVSDAEYLFMDEITNALDENNRKKLFQSLTSLVAKNKLIIISSHYKEDITDVCDYLVEIENERLVVSKV